MTEFLSLLLAGLAGGILAGLLGVGGGVFYLLVLPWALSRAGIPEDQMVQFVIANSIFGTLFAALSGSVTQMRQKTFYLKNVIWVSLGAIVMALLTLYLFVNTPLYSKATFSAVIIFLMSFILWRTLVKNFKKKAAFPPDSGPYAAPWLLLAGGTGGLVAALSGLGGGAIVVPFLNLILKIDIKKAKSISLGMIFFMALWMTLFNMSQTVPVELEAKHLGYIVFPVVLPLGIGVVIGSPFGVKWSNRLTSRAVAILFSIFIFVVIVKQIIALLAA